MGKQAIMATADHPVLYIWNKCQFSGTRWKKKVRAVMLEENHAGLLFFGHKLEDGRFGISEYTSGMSVGDGDSAADAYSKFMHNVEKYPINAWLIQVAKRIKEYGSPANILPNGKTKISINFLRRL